MTYGNPNDVHFSVFGLVPVDFNPVNGTGGQSPYCPIPVTRS